MSNNLARARARVAAGEWLAHYCGVQDPKTMTFGVAEILKAFESGYVSQIDYDVLGGDDLTLTATVLEAAIKGGAFTPSDMERAAKEMFGARDRINRLINGQQALIDEHAIRVAEGQRQLDNATSLMTEAVEHLKMHAGHYLDQVQRLKGRTPDDPALVMLHIEDAQANADINTLMAARLEAWLAGEDQFPVSLDTAEPGGRTLADCKAKFVNTAENFAGFPRGGVVTKGPSGDIPAILQRGEERRRLNPIDILREVAEGMVDGEVIKGVDGPSFDLAREYMDQPVEISALDAPPRREGDLIMSPPTPEPAIILDAPALADDVETVDQIAVRKHWCEESGFKYWPGGDGPPADLDEDGEVLIDWGENTESGPRFTMCGVGELTPMPGLWAETIDPESFGTIIGYHADPTLIEHSEPISTPPTRRVGVRSEGGVVTEIDQTIDYGTDGPDFDFSKPITIRGNLYVPAGWPTPGAAAADGLKPRDLIAAEPDPLAALVQARKWLTSAEDLIMLAADHIRGVTGANPGSDSEEICQRLDAWLAPWQLALPPRRNDHANRMEIPAPAPPACGLRGPRNRG